MWHQHLLYSRHYWEALCRDTLEMPLHHGPTQGGVAEGRKYHAWYEDTLASYRRYFGEPPKDLWPASEERFDERNDFIRVNRRDVVTLDRALLRRGAIASLLAAAARDGSRARASRRGCARSGWWAVGGGLPRRVLARDHYRCRRCAQRAKRTRRRSKGDGAVAAGVQPAVRGLRRRIWMSTVVNRSTAAPVAAVALAVVVAAAEEEGTGAAAVSGQV